MFIGEGELQHCNTMPFLHKNVLFAYTLTLSFAYLLYKFSIFRVKKDLKIML